MWAARAVLLGLRARAWGQLTPLESSSCSKTSPQKRSSGPELAPRSTSFWLTHIPSQVSEPRCVQGSLHTPTPGHMAVEEMGPLVSCRLQNPIPPSRASTGCARSRQDQKSLHTPPASALALPGFALASRGARTARLGTTPLL